MSQLRQLIESGKKKGYVLCDEIDELLPEGYEGGPELDDILAALESSGIDVVAAPGPEPPDDLRGDGDDVIAEPDFSDADDPVQIYLREVCDVPPLSRDDEMALARLRTKAAEIQLIEANLRAVVSIARRYANHGVHVLDLILEGNDGLMNAAERFNPARGYRFSTYAAWWVRQSILRRLRK